MMSKKHQKDQGPAEPVGGENTPIPQDSEQLPTTWDGDEAPDVDARLDGEDAQPVGHTIDGTEPDEAQLPLPGVTGHAQAVAQVTAHHQGVEEALHKYAHTVDGTQFVGNKGITLAEALDANNTQLQAKLKGLGA